MLADLEKDTMTPKQRFKWTAYSEGASFLVLLGVAMPLKYLFDLPLAVRVVGMLHGVLFILYALLVMEALGAGRFNLRTAALAMLASVLPFGPFVFERKFGPRPADV
jgi:integral membrane protein